MQYQEVKPHPALQGLIACYFFLRLEPGAPDQEELVIPDGTPGLMFVQQARFTRYHPEAPGDQQFVAKSCLFGQKTRPVRYSFDTPGLSCFGVKFQPQGLFAFTGMPSSELTDTMADAGPLLGKSFYPLEDRLVHAAGFREKAALLDNFFFKKQCPDNSPDQLLVCGVLEYIHRVQGQTGVQSILERFQLNYKRLERLFKKHVGIGPKLYCCITRFHATFRPLPYPAPHNLTQLAYASGYFDQMHFIKEVRQFTHLTPKQFYRRRLGLIATHQRQLVLDRLG